MWWKKGGREGEKKRKEKGRRQDPAIQNLEIIGKVILPAKMVPTESSDLWESGLKSNLLFHLSKAGWRLLFFLLRFLISEKQYILLPRGNVLLPNKMGKMDMVLGVSGFCLPRSPNSPASLWNACLSFQRQDMTVLMANILPEFFSDHIIFSVEFCFHTQWLGVEDFHVSSLLL